jgi:hypothetical protein
VKTGPRDKPAEDVVIKKVIVSHAKPGKGAAAKAKASAATPAPGGGKP